MPKKVLEGITPAAKASQRRKLGSLRSLTVQPATRQRYDKAVNGFLSFLKTNQVVLPSRRDLLDPLVCDYLEELWSSGQGRGLANDTLAGLQDFDAKIRGCLPGAWRLLKAWHVNEIPNRAPPFPDYIVHAMCGWAIFHGHGTFAVSLLVGFYGMLRTGELLGLRAQDFKSHESQRKLLISLGLTKSGKRAGAAESVVLGLDLPVNAVRHWLSLSRPSTPLAKNPANWRSLFNQAIEALSLSSYGFRPYSLRRGGATWWFGKHRP